MADAQNKGGRPPISEEEKKDILHKLEPYLKGGLSVSKAILEAGVPNSTFYKLMGEDEGFREKINQYRNFTAILLNNAIVTELQTIIRKQTGYTDDKGKKHPPEKLKKEDREFLWKFALNSNFTKDMFGERKDVNLFDPEAEIQKVKGILEEQTTKEMPDIDTEPDE
jgi:hypothetical protein